MPSFLAPEDTSAPAGAQSPELGHKGDVWSLGVLLFTLLTGELPFTLSTEVKEKHVNRIRARVCQARRHTTTPTNTLCVVGRHCVVGVRASEPCRTKRLLRCSSYGLVTHVLPFSQRIGRRAAKPIQRLASTRLAPVQGTFVEPAVKAFERLPSDVKHLLQCLLARNPQERPDAWQVCAALDCCCMVSAQLQSHTYC